MGSESRVIESIERVKRSGYQSIGGRWHHRASPLDAGVVGEESPRPTHTGIRTSKLESRTTIADLSKVGRSDPRTAQVDLYAPRAA